MPARTAQTPESVESIFYGAQEPAYKQNAGDDQFMCFDLKYSKFPMRTAFEILINALVIDGIDCGVRAQDDLGCIFLIVMEPHRGSTQDAALLLPSRMFIARQTESFPSTKRHPSSTHTFSLIYFAH